MDQFAPPHVWTLLRISRSLRATTLSWQKKLDCNMVTSAYGWSPNGFFLKLAKFIIAQGCASCDIRCIQMYCVSTHETSARGTPSYSEVSLRSHQLPRGWIIDGCFKFRCLERVPAWISTISNSWNKPTQGAAVIYVFRSSSGPHPRFRCKRDRAAQRELNHVARLQQQRGTRQVG